MNAIERPDEARPILALSQRMCCVLHWVGVALAMAVLALLALSTRLNLLDERPGGDPFEIQVKPVFTAAFAIGGRGRLEVEARRRG